ncbi:beta-N-acetylhexosaminidase [Pseudogracilibacillus auburnensis]|uniref:Glycosyl hydrolase family 20 n=1 Tax=Pseudogracilibacillus auburnensis TaxID=1494959 RepID=A0A2V3W0Y0_9BACI|nr:glycosyl hydrolase family 20 [Pseudogracilibacillus auburnensis]
MKIKLADDYPSLLNGLKALQTDFNFEISESAEIELVCKQNKDHHGLTVSFDNGTGQIIYQKTNQFFRAFGLLLEKVQKGETTFSFDETAQFKTVGPMFDFSRNAVMKPNCFYEMIRILAMMGFDSAMLYMEDTYEVKGEPYFGYMRGRYTEEELKKLDDYAHQFGIELIPCIQTLAHLEEFLKWDAAYQYKDTRGALLLESEATYSLLEKMIHAASTPFRSKRIHIGMDEAEELGRGIFLNKNGYKPRFELMAVHLDRVLQITDQLGLEAVMWSDMFLKLASETGDRYSKTTEIPDHIIEQTPKQVQLMYWQYNSTDTDHYVKIIEQHKAFNKKPAFAGGMWIWNTFATNYQLSLQASEAALNACKQTGVDDVFVTLWGDDGIENNPYTALLGLQYYAEHAYAEKLDQDKLYDRVAFCTGIAAEKYLMFNKLDTPPGVAADNLEQTNPSKFLLWQDILLGVFDKHIEGLDMDSYFQSLAEEFQHSRNNKDKLDYIFDVPQKLSRVLALKAGIGVKLKEAYDNKDRKELKNIANVIIPEIINRVNDLRKAHRNQWLRMNKPFGWEVIDIRYGGLINRLDTASCRINDYLNEEINFIDELEQERLYYSPNIEHSTSLGWCSYYYRMASPNVFFHVLPIY